mgnify:CR=1 FL=1|tara:strand:- start:86 stop:721 length:636 start_codon:yes stop_codon:yes gene_type:complete
MIIDGEFPYIIKEVPSNIINELKEEINKDSLPAYNHKLAGNIEKEFQLVNQNHKLNNFVYDLCEEFINKHEIIKGPDGFFIDKRVLEKTFLVDSTWVNFQKKYEFNPQHVHSGIFSFVLYVQVPYFIQEEDQHVNSKNARNKLNSRFLFFGAKPSGELISKSLDIDKTWENKMILFPSFLDHGVHPFFTSDEYRISISGNVNHRFINHEYF